MSMGQGSTENSTLQQQPNGTLQAEVRSGTASRLLAVLIYFFLGETSDGFSFFVLDFRLSNATTKFEQFEPKLHKPGGFCENLVVVSIFTRVHSTTLNSKLAKLAPYSLSPAITSIGGAT
jgi:hypothetical protein